MLGSNGGGPAGPAQPQVLIQIVAVPNPDGTVGFSVMTSISSLAEALGVLELAKDALKHQAAKQEPASRLQIARGNVPRS